MQATSLDERPVGLRLKMDDRHLVLRLKMDGPRMRHTESPMHVRPSYMASRGGRCLNENSLYGPWRLLDKGASKSKRE